MFWAFLLCVCVCVMHVACTGMCLCEQFELRRKCCLFSVCVCVYLVSVGCQRLALCQHYKCTGSQIKRILDEPTLRTSELVSTPESCFYFLRVSNVYTPFISRVKTPSCSFQDTTLHDNEMKV